jgi:hypothetical protein
MTSSETRTEASEEGRAPAPAAGRSRGPTVVAVLLAGVPLAIGWAVILLYHRWYVTPAVVMLAIGWAGIVLLAYYGWRAAMEVADPTADEEEFWRPRGQADELELEKRTLLKAIKEIEFDHGMGKMSDEDAAELIEYYRRRAIEVFKALEAEAGGASSYKRPIAEQPITEQIERDVKARLEVDRARAGKRRKAQTKKGGGAEAAATDQKKEGGGAEAAATETSSSDADEVEASEARRAEESA